MFHPGLIKKEVNMFLHNRNSKFKSIFFFLSLSLFFCSTLYSQDIIQSRNQDNKFFRFLDLFQSIPNVDSLPVIHRIEYSTYQSKLIDTSFYPFVCLIPFSHSYATFKVECIDGFLVCVQHVLSSELSDFQFIELLSFNKQGCLLERVVIPYLKKGCISSPYEDSYEAILSVSTTEVFVIGKKYKEGTDEEKFEKHHFQINTDATLLPIPHK